MLGERETLARASGPTPVQLKILRYKAAGKTDGYVARALNVGERTVRRQLDELEAKLGVRGRAQLFIEVGRRGWLDLRREQDE